LSEQAEKATACIFDPKRPAIGSKSASINGSTARIARVGLLQEQQKGIWRPGIGVERLRWNCARRQVREVKLNSDDLGL
jgi:hypothetical protein